MYNIISLTEKYVPRIENAESYLKSLCHKKATSLYGNIPLVVQNRIDSEIKYLKQNNDLIHMTIFAKVMENKEIQPYMVYTQSKLTYSIISYLVGITKTNPLKPHYRCSKCHFIDFDTDKYNTKIGFDLPNKICPSCGKNLIKDGFSLDNIFLFGNNKSLNIELKVPNYLKEHIIEIIESISGIGKVIDLPNQWKEYKSKNCNEKVIIPSYLDCKNILNINKNSLYTFRLLSNKIIEECKRQNISAIPFDERKYINYYTKHKNIIMCREEELEVINACNPHTISDIMKVMALSINNTWNNKGKHLIKNNLATIKTIISTRDDILELLSASGVPYEQSLEIINEGKWKNLSKNHRKILLKHNIPQWCIEFCNKNGFLWDRGCIAEIMMLNWLSLCLNNDK